MNRRDALKSLASLVGATGLTVTPVTTLEAQGVELTILRCPGVMSQEQAERLTHYWTEAVKGTALENRKVIVLMEGLTVEFVRTKNA